MNDSHNESWNACSFFYEVRRNWFIMGAEDQGLGVAGYTWPPGGPFIPNCFSYQRIMNGPLTAIFCFAGFAANIFCSRVFVYPKSPPKIYQYLVALAIWDNITLLGAFLAYSLPYCIHGCMPLTGSYFYVVHIAFVLSNSSLPGCIWVMSTLCIDRAFAIYKPFKHRRLSSVEKTRMFLVLVSVVALLYGIPTYFELNMYQCPADKSLLINEDFVYLHPSKVRESNVLYQKVYKIVGGIVFQSIIPFFVLLVGTFCLLLHIRNAHNTYVKNGPLAARTSFDERFTVNRSETQWRLAKRKHSPRVSTPSQRHQKNAKKQGSTLLVILSTKIIISRVLTVAIDIIEDWFGSATFTQSPMAVRLVTVSNLLVVVNAATNILVYLAFSKDFRTISRLLFNGKQNGSMTDIRLTVASMQSPSMLAHNKRMERAKSACERAHHMANTRERAQSACGEIQHVNLPRERERATITWMQQSARATSTCTISRDSWNSQAIDV